MTSSFRETSWTLVEQSRGKDEDARLALSELCKRCYAPVQKFIALWCRDQEAARDLTHGFFARVLEGGSLNGAERERGRFRSYLLGAVKHFLCEATAHEQRLKRGLQHEHVTLEDEPLNDERMLAPDAEFDRAWALALLDRSLAILQQEMEASGKGAVFEALKPWLAGTAVQGQQLLAAKALGISETAVRVLVHRLRKRFREIIESEVSQTLEIGADVADELRHLLAVL
jgi:RNA polymerase sigma-70 factor (ECF subfamily)